jgi:ABC-type transporter Mla subunit MlaD
MPKPRLTESPWFWVYLFGTAALIAMFLIGRKADEVQAQRDANFAQRQHSLDLQAREPSARDSDPPPPADEEPAETRFVDFRPFYFLFGAVTVVAWVMLWVSYFRRRSASSDEEAAPPD